MNRRIPRYLLVGAATTAVSIAVYYLCVWLGLDPARPLQLQTANVLSWLCSVSFAYLLNRSYVFGAGGRPTPGEALHFFGGRAATLLMDMGLMALLVTVLDLPHGICKIGVQAAVITANYFLAKRSFKM